MEDIQTRLKEASQNCLEAYAAWEGQKKDSKVQEDLHSAIHELRKVSSRLEIELAISERDQMTSKPIPIPAHRANSKGGDNGSILEGDDDSNGKKKGGPVVQSSKPRRKRTSKKSS